MKFFVILFCFLNILIRVQVVACSDTSELNERTANVWDMKWHSVKEVPEWTNGYRGKAIRTDGYSTYLDKDLIQEVKSMDAWFALESYPTDTAACIALLNLDRHFSFSLCISRFGELIAMAQDLENRVSEIFPMQKKINRFEWFNVGVLLRDSSFSCFLDGVHLKDISFSRKTDKISRWQLRLGKDFREKKMGMYDVTSINGLIDIPRLSSSQTFDLEKKEVIEAKRCKPILSIPASRFENDFNRPAYHLLPAANWTNETHGLFQYNDRFHIFNQKNASSIFLGQINWGHFTSTDLIHWTEERPALTPDKSYDKYGIWSGCAIINDKGVPQLFYTSGGDKNGISLAFPEDENLINWIKYEENPVIYGQPDGLKRGDMRDPFVWKEGAVWYMIVGYGIEGDGCSRGALLLYKSFDAKKWQYVHLLFEGNPAVDHSGVFWEMPFFKRFGDKYVLQVNRVPYKGIPARSQYWVGRFENEKFIPDDPRPQNLEVINRLLSPSIWALNDTTSVAMAIIPDEIAEAASYKQGWAHLYSIPRILSLKDGKKLVQRPFPGLKDLRGDYFYLKKQPLIDSSTYLIPNTSHQVELDIEFYPKDAKRFGVIIGKNPKGDEQTSIYFNRNTQELIIDHTYSSRRKGIPSRIRKDTYLLKDNVEKVSLHLFIDGSVIEGFINNEDAFTARIFPLNENSTQIELFSDGKNCEVEAEMWKLNAAKVKTNY